MKKVRISLGSFVLALALFPAVLQILGEDPAASKPELVNFLKLGPGRGHPGRVQGLMPPHAIQATPFSGYTAHSPFVSRVATTKSRLPSSSRLLSKLSAQGSDVKDLLRL